nr:hypothetical protein [uncultured Carboxylicivirga sp.]
MSKVPKIKSFNDLAYYKQNLQYQLKYSELALKDTAYEFETYLQVSAANSLKEYFQNLIRSYLIKLMKRHSTN